MIYRFLAKIMYSQEPVVSRTDPLQAYSDVDTDGPDNLRSYQTLVQGWFLV